MSRFFLLALGLLVAVFATVAQADTLYVAWTSGTTGVIVPYDMGTSPPTPSSAVESGDRCRGLAIAPAGSTYAGDIFAESDTYTGIKAFNRTTGLVDWSYKATTNGFQALAIDSSGNLYADCSAEHYIYKFDAATMTPNKTWCGTPSGTIYWAGSDLEVYGDNLYAAVAYGTSGSTPGGIGVIPLSTGVATWLVQWPTGAVSKGPNGIAFGSDGTIYAACHDSREVVRITPSSPGVYPWSNAVQILKEATSVGAYQDIDYWNGVLYMKTNGPRVYSCSNPTDAIPTWNKTYITPAAGYTSEIGYLAIYVPEPGTLAMLACGLAGLLCYAWRKRR